MTRWRALVRLAKIILGLRRITPGLWERPTPRSLREVPPLDTGGGGFYRPAHRQQDPAVDPREPGGGESASRGSDHGWCNCTMASGAMALDFATQGRLAKWGGDLRHRQGDLDGGTDLYDLREAFAAYGEDLVIRSGRGWDALKQDRAEGRFLVVQGEGNVPGSETFDGGHACAVGPETRDGDWLFGDPLASGWQWVPPSKVRDWMEAWAGPGLAWARTTREVPPEPDPAPEPEPPPTPAPPPPGPGYAEGVAQGRLDGSAAALDAVFASWRPGTWPPDLSAPLWDVAAWDGATWPWPWPYPLAALLAARTPAAWGTAGWTAATWRTADAPPVPPDLPAFGEWDLDAWPVTWGA